MKDAVLVVNVGSSSIRFAVFGHATAEGDLFRFCSGAVAGIGARPRFATYRSKTGRETNASSKTKAVAAQNHHQALQVILDWLDGNTSHLRFIANGHRVVHGGTFYSQAVRVDTGVLDQLQSLVRLAPLHQPHALDAIKALMTRYPDLPQVACFDTAFHAHMPQREQHFALPGSLLQQGVRRYGFHGLSYEYIASVLPHYLGAAANSKVVIAHLGHGVSMCAVNKRQSIATSMSFTPLDGLPMGTRSGAIDPAVVLYMLELGMTGREISDLLHHQSGLLGLSGISDDMRTLLSSTDANSIGAVDFFCYRVSRELGSLAAALGGLDAVVFTGGIGEHAIPVRANICRNSGWLGIEIDDLANQANASRISADASAVSVWVIPTDEEQVIARNTVKIVRGEGGSL